MTNLFTSWQLSHTVYHKESHIKFLTYRHYQHFVTKNRYRGKRSNRCQAAFPQFPRFILTPLSGHYNAITYPWLPFFISCMVTSVCSLLPRLCLVVFFTFFVFFSLMVKFELTSTSPMMTDGVWSFETGGGKRYTNAVCWRNGATEYSLRKLVNRARFSFWVFLENLHNDFLVSGAMAIMSVIELKFFGEMEWAMRSLSRSDIARDGGLTIAQWLRLRVSLL